MEILSNIENYNKTVEVAVNSVFPFKKTPANIIKRGFEYHPLGLAKTLLYDTPKVLSSRMAPSQYINNLSKGLTGMEQVALGYVLASAGIITAGKPEDDKEAGLERLEGKQAYALNIGGHYYTIDWAVPWSMGIITGVEIRELIDNKGLNAEAFLESLFRMTDPVIELSFLQSLDNLIKAMAYGKENAISNAVMEMPFSYASQFVPTVLGQIARTVDPVQRDTYTVNPESPLGRNTQQFLNQQAAKIPGLSQRLNPSLDQWGQENVDQNPLPVRALEQMASPGFYKKQTGDPVNAEIRRLYDATGDKSIMPAYAPTSVTVDGETIKFDRQKFEQYARILGQGKHELHSTLFGLAAYKNLPDAGKVSAIDYANEYATAIAKEKALGVKSEGWIAKAKDVEKAGIPLGRQIAMRAAAKESNNDEDKVKAIAKGLKLPQGQAQEMFTIAEKYRFSASDFTDNQQAQMKYAKQAYNLSNGDFIKMYNATIGVEGRRTGMAKQSPAPKMLIC